MNYLIYPFKVMRITQSYNGETSHLPYSTGKPADYPLDEGADDSGRSYAYCPCDEVEIVRMHGVGSSGTNTVWITSTSKVHFADGSTDFATLMFIHPNDDDLKKLKVGQKFKRKEKMFREGTDGHATGNHLHFSVGKGKIKGNGWTENNKGKWVLTTTDGTIKPEKAFYIDTKFTKVVNKKGLKFKDLPETKSTEYIVDTPRGLNCRKEPTTKKKNVVTTFPKGTKLSITETKSAEGYKWGKCSKGWVALDYCKKI